MADRNPLPIRDGWTTLRWFSAFVMCSTVSLTHGCGIAVHEAAQGRGETVLVGSDSAGAVIEVVMETTKFVRARVTDVVLGTAEAEPFAENAGGIEFSVHFPTGARIIYKGLPNYEDKSDILTVSGVWHQVPGGVFGADAGSWKVSRVTEP